MSNPEESTESPLAFGAPRTVSIPTNDTTYKDISEYYPGSDLPITLIEIHQQASGEYKSSQNTYYVAYSPRDRVHSLFNAVTLTQAREESGIQPTSTHLPTHVSFQAVKLNPGQVRDYLNLAAAEARAEADKFPVSRGPHLPITFESYAPNK